MSVAVYGGTFDPPHIGHLEAARTVLRQEDVRRLLVIPDRIPPHKAQAPGGPGPEERLELTRLCFSGLPRTEVLDLELRREGPSYTWMTLRELKKLYPDETLLLLMGTDMALTLDHWKRSDEIFRLAEIGVLARRGGDDAALEETAERYRRTYAARIRVIRHEPEEVSSTEVRSALPERRGSGLVTPEVYAEILRRRLYGARPDIEALWSMALPLQLPERLDHVRGCCETAAALARRWGADEGDAREAAVCHDLTKGIDLDGQLKLLEKYAMIADADERASVNLLHGITASSLAGERFGSPEEIRSAIRWHTTGRADMTLLEKIVCLADFMEPTRRFADLTEVRALAYEDLDAALLESLRMTVESLRRRKLPIHRHTLEAIASLEHKTENTAADAAEEREL